MDTRDGKPPNPILHGAMYLMSAQLSSRLMTFLANQVLLFHVSPDALGMSMQLELFSMTVLQFSRETIRMAVQSHPKNEQDKSAKDAQKERATHGSLDRHSNSSIQVAVNMSYLAIISGFSMLYLLRLLCFQYMPTKTSYDPNFRTSLLLVGLSTAIELLSEPCFAVINQKQLYQSRAIIETISSLARALCSCGFAILLNRLGANRGPLPHAVGHVAYSLFLLGGSLFVVTSMADRHDISLRPVYTSKGENSCISKFIPSALLFRSANVFLQSIVKYVLTQGDVMIVTALSTLEEQGSYALASNYGGLVARIVFQPVEESSRAAFGLWLSDGSRGLEAARSYLEDIVYGYSLLTIFAWSVGPLFLPLAFQIFLSRLWSASNLEKVLRSYCYYIPLLAFNGITEAFVSSAASNAELRSQAIWMGVCSVAFAFASYVFLGVAKLGVQGLVWANIVNMALRIGWSFLFIQTYFHRNPQVPFRVLTLRRETWVVGVTAWGCVLAGYGIAPDGISSGQMFVTGAAIIATILYLEKHPLRERLLRYLGSRSKAPGTHLTR